VSLLLFLLFQHRLPDRTIETLTNAAGWHLATTVLRTKCQSGLSRSWVRRYFVTIRMSRCKRWRVERAASRCQGCPLMRWISSREDCLI
jgi:hypothetical protein